MNSLMESQVSAALLELGEQYGIALSESAVNVCLQHFRVLLKWNRVMNLVGDLTVENAVRRHYGESLFLSIALGASWRRVVDYGSGAGFPGIGIGALRADFQVTLLEIRQKRVAFLREATRSVANLNVFGGSAIDYPDALDVVVARAVDIGEVLDFATHRGVPACLLVGSVDAEKWASRLDEQGRHYTIASVPWRPQSVVLSVDPVDSTTIPSKSRST